MYEIYLSTMNERELITRGIVEVLHNLHDKILATLDDEYFKEPLEE